MAIGRPPYSSIYAGCTDENVEKRTFSTTAASYDMLAPMPAARTRALLSPATSRRDSRCLFLVSVAPRGCHSKAPATPGGVRLRRGGTPCRGRTAISRVTPCQLPRAIGQPEAARACAGPVLSTDGPPGTKLQPIHRQKFEWGKLYRVHAAHARRQRRRSFRPAALRRRPAVCRLSQRGAFPASFGRACPVDGFS